MSKKAKDEMTEKQIQELNLFERNEKEREIMIQERNQKLSEELKL